MMASYGRPVQARTGPEGREPQQKRRRIGKLVAGASQTPNSQLFGPASAAAHPEVRVAQKRSPFSSHARQAEHVARAPPGFSRVSGAGFGTICWDVSRG